MKAKYYADADLISWRISEKPYEYASRSGNFVVHFDKNDEPVLIEILDASKFLKDLNKALPKSVKKELWDQAPTSVAHKIK